MSDEVLTVLVDGILTVTINRPHAKNAVNRAVAKGIAAAMDELDRNPDIRVAILTGDAQSFCAGMDLKAFVAGELPMVAGRGFGGLVEAPPAKPLIAAVEGYALAGGFELALCCDLIVAASNARFGLPEAKRGLVAAAGGLLRLPRQVPPRIAMELALTGDYISAQRAYEIGLINRLTAPGESLAVARQLALSIAANGPLAVAATKKVMTTSQDWSTAEQFACQARLTDPIFRSEDALEGAKAFAEKRAPAWKGR